MYCDCHLHTEFSSDSEAPVRSQLDRAVELGIPTICLTDHMDLDFPPGPMNFQFDPEAYFDTLLPLKEEYKDRLKLHIGVELGLQPHIPDMLAEMAVRKPWDYIIGSVHLVKRIDPYEPEYWMDKSDEAGHLAYFEEVLESIRAYSDFDSLGHLDYIVRYGRQKSQSYDWRKYQDIIDEILKICVRKDICLECNTAGYKAGLGHPNPTEEILVHYRKLGGCGITLGSDAHEPRHMGFSFDTIGDTLKRCGYSEYVVFEGRKPHYLPL